MAGAPRMHGAPWPALSLTIMPLLRAVALCRRNASLAPQRPPLTQKKTRASSKLTWRPSWVICSCPSPTCTCALRASCRPQAQTAAQRASRRASRCRSCPRLPPTPPAPRRSSPRCVCFLCAVCISWETHTYRTHSSHQGLASRLHKRATLRRLAIYYDPSVRQRCLARALHAQCCMHLDTTHT
jgi:hypothetical protein